MVRGVRDNIKNRAQRSCRIWLAERLISRSFTTAPPRCSPTEENPLQKLVFQFAHTPPAILSRLGALSAAITPHPAGLNGGHF
jgi:hypothetical protein